MIQWCALAATLLFVAWVIDMAIYEHKRNR